MKKFALNPPCPRPSLAPGQRADPTSIKRGEDYADEWAKRQAKLAKQAKEVVKKFNEDSADAAAEVTTSKKAMPKKPARKPQSLYCGGCEFFICLYRCVGLLRSLLLD